MNEEKNTKILAIVLVVLVIGLGIYKLFVNKKTNNVSVDTESIVIVDDVNRFYTVSNCASRYINYLFAKDTDNLLILLSDKYKLENNISSNNIYDYIGNIDYNYSFSAKKMYEQRISKTSYKYYIHGKLIDDYFEINHSTGIDYYIAVILDESNTTFAIEPYSSEEFNKLGETR